MIVMVTIFYILILDISDTWNVLIINFIGVFENHISALGEYIFLFDCLEQVDVIFL